MPFEFRLPDVGEGIDAGEIVQWHVTIGEYVRADQPLVDVQTDKAIVTIPCPVSGTVLSLPAIEGDTVPVGELLAVFDAAELDQPAAMNDMTAAANDLAPKRTAVPTHGSARPLASPAVRALAREAGVDLAALVGSGPGGRLLRQDIVATRGVESTAAAPLPQATRSPASDEVVALRGTRRVIARGMTLSWQSIPHIIDFREVDMTQLIAARQALRADGERRGGSELADVLTLMPLIAKIAVTVVKRHRALNAALDLDREEITYHRAVHLSVAISAPSGLVTPVIRDADRKSVPDIAREIAALAAAARAQQLTPDQLTGGTFMINNYGALGSPLSTPLIAPGQSSNLGFGRVEERAVARAGEVVVRAVMNVSCSGDHRVLDGQELAAFCNELVATIEDPFLLLGDLA
jgi:pyruvate dehydrogenase E2 component (dihydrolipoamide acetyltransferase)